MSPLSHVVKLPLWKFLFSRLSLCAVPLTNCTPCFGHKLCAPSYIHPKFTLLTSFCFRLIYSMTNEACVTDRQTDVQTSANQRALVTLLFPRWRHQYSSRLTETWPALGPIHNTRVLLHVTDRQTYRPVPIGGHLSHLCPQAAPPVQQQADWVMAGTWSECCRHRPSFASV